jgi:hypothetical protein
MKRVLIPFALGGALVASFPAFAVNGHVLQVHHGFDCVEFVLLEDAVVGTCGSNIFTGTGKIIDSCLDGVPWYSIQTGQGNGQTQLSLGQLPYFIAATSAIDTAFRAYQSETQFLYVQDGITGSVVVGNEVALLNDSSIVGFDVSGSFTCKNLDGSGTHTTLGVANINTPASAIQ